MFCHTEPLARLERTLARCGQEDSVNASSSRRRPQATSARYRHACWRCASTATRLQRPQDVPILLSMLHAYQRTPTLRCSLSDAWIPPAAYRQGHGTESRLQQLVGQRHVLPRHCGSYRCYCLHTPRFSGTGRFWDGSEVACMRAPPSLPATAPVYTPRVRVALQTTVGLESI